MPHYRHPVTAKDESLNIGEIECGFRGCSRVSIRRGDVMSPSAEHAAEESSALLCRWLQYLAFLAHCSFLHDPRSRPLPRSRSADAVEACYQAVADIDLLSAIRAWMS